VAAPARTAERRADRRRLLRADREGRRALSVSRPARPPRTGPRSSRAPRRACRPVEDLSTTLADGLRHDTLDVAFLSIVDEADRRGLELQLLAEEQLVVVLPARHRLAGSTHTSIAELRDEEFVTFSEGATIRRAVQRIARDAGFEPRIAFETREVARTRAIVASGLGVAVLPAPTPKPSDRRCRSST
jgi:DNA-binding transcriptional LysR family regulator